ncbi:MAG: hypothetical protein AABW46_03575 [Nanoarchaeota archaeon]
MNNSNMVIIVAIVIIALIALSYPSFVEMGTNVITGKQTQVTVASSANIQNYFAIAVSSTLSSPGIVWSNIVSLPVTDLNADGNVPTGSTQYFTTVSTDSNVNVAFCINANQPLTSGVNTIPLTNYEWDSGLVATGLGQPVLPGVAMPQSPVFGAADTNIAPGSSDYFRFWLTVAGSQAAGLYTNQITFKGVQTGNVC